MHFENIDGLQTNGDLASYKYRDWEELRHETLLYF